MAIITDVNIFIDLSNHDNFNYKYLKNTKYTHSNFFYTLKRNIVMNTFANFILNLMLRFTNINF